MFWTNPRRRPFVSKGTIDALKKNFTPAEVRQLDQLGTVIDLAAGARLVQGDEVGREALVLISGTASVIRDGETIATIKPGEMIGEIALISGEPRNATVVADSDVSAYVMSRNEFAMLMARCPGLEARTHINAINRLQRL